MHKTILVTGGSGQLAQSIKSISHSFPAHWLFADRHDLDILDEQQVTSFFDRYAIDICINCAAYTAVDKAEIEQELAIAINESAVIHLVSECNKHNTLLVHISSDYVYNSISIRPLQETDTCKPRGVYAGSKRAGEIAIIEQCEEYLIFRVSWLYSEFGQNFVKSMLRLGSEKESLKIVSDQMGTPTYALDFAHDLLNIIWSDKLDTSSLNQVYNYSNLGVTHWAAFATAIFKYAQLPCVVSEISTKEYGAPAPRPLWSVMDKSKIINTFSLTLYPWEHSLHICLDKLLRPT